MKTKELALGASGIGLLIGSIVGLVVGSTLPFVDPDRSQKAILVVLAVTVGVIWMMTAILCGYRKSVVTVVCAICSYSLSVFIVVATTYTAYLWLVDVLPPTIPSRIKAMMAVLITMVLISLIGRVIVLQSSYKQAPLPERVC